MTHVTKFRIAAPCLLSVLLYFFSVSLYANDPKPEPGKQVAQSVELPASTSTWLWGQDGMKNIGNPRPVDETKTEIVRYWIYLPGDYDAQAETGGAPLMLFLHGAGERGNNPDEIGKVKVHGPPKLLDREEFRKNWPCVTVSPQCKNDYAWSPGQLMLLLDHIEKEYKIDKRRIYVTGISMGGFGTWMCLRENPDRFAAAAPICGGGDAKWGEKLTNVPIWVFHGNRDGVVPVRLSENLVGTIKKAGGNRVVFTAYDGVDHDSWTRTYDNQLLYDWMLSNVRDDAETIDHEH